MTSPTPVWRQDFDQLLAATLAEVEALAAKQPGYPGGESWRRQLHAMRAWSSAGDPTPEQRGRIGIGLIAARELEPAPPETQGLVDRLHLLNYAWRHWPSGASFTGSLADLPAALENRAAKAPPPIPAHGKARSSLTMRNGLILLILLILLSALMRIAAPNLIDPRPRGASPPRPLATVPAMPDAPRQKALINAQSATWRCAIGGDSRFSDAHTGPMQYQEPPHEKLRRGLGPCPGPGPVGLRPNADAIE
jgi:hypothetical protein